MRLGPFFALGLALANATSAQAETDAALVGLWARQEDDGWVFSYNFHPDGTFEVKTQSSPQSETIQTTKGNWYIQRSMLVTKPELSTQYKVMGLGQGQLYSLKMPDQERSYTIKGVVLMLNEKFIKINSSRVDMETAMSKGMRDFENLPPEKQQKIREEMAKV